MMKYQIGHVLKQEAAGRQHTYRLASMFQTVNRRGFDAKVLVWTGSCATCGCSFEATGSRNGRRYLIRNCPAHRRKRRSSAPISENLGRTSVEPRVASVSTRQLRRLSSF
jgi:hypothetical protein